jgi:hypothetical protein
MFPGFPAQISKVPEKYSKKSAEPQKKIQKKISSSQMKKFFCGEQKVTRRTWFGRSLRSLEQRNSHGDRSTVFEYYTKEISNFKILLTTISGSKNKQNKRKSRGEHGSDARFARLDKRNSKGMLASLAT